MARRFAAWAVALSVAAAAVAPDAMAGQYQLHSCRLPDGTRAPLVDWVASGGNDARFERTDSCVAAGYFDVRMSPGATQAGDSGLHWRLALPAGVRLRRMRGQLASTSRAGPHVVDVIAGNGQGNLSLGFGGGRGSALRWDDPANAFDTGIFSPAANYLFGARCAGGATCGPLSGTEPKAYVRVFRAEATLEDLSIPEVESIGGPLLAPGAHSGTEGFSLVASDLGAGVYRLIVELDGVVRLREVLDSSAGQCADQVPGNLSEHDFNRASPCLPRVSGSRTLDTRLLPDGRHTLRLLVEDAAGNTRVAAGPVEGWTVDNRPPRGPGTDRTPAHPGVVPSAANGSPATDRARLELFFLAARTRRVCRSVLRRGRVGRRCTHVRTRESVRRGPSLRTPYGRRLRMTGRLMTVDGRPIADAQVHLRRQRRGARRALERFDVRTDSTGRFRTTIGRSPSERIRVAYYATSTARPVRSRVLTRLVSAGIAVRAVRRGRSVLLLGRLRGGSRPAGGVRIRAEARLHGGWVALAARRMRARASVEVPRRAFGAGIHRFRLRVLRTRGYPYEPAASRAISVRLPR